MSRTWFVTGTDTGVGKTSVCCALLELAASRGLSTAAVKPVAAGCDAQGRSEDALLLQASMTANLPYEQVNPVALRAPIAPHIAAGQEGRRLQVAQLAGRCRGVMLGGWDLVLVEGAGGWRVPLNARETLADLAVQLGAGVILVVGMRLGCINHAVLSAEAVRGDGLGLVGWVANQCGARMACHDENLAALDALLPAPRLGNIPHLPQFSPRLAAEYIEMPAL